MFSAAPQVGRRCAFCRELPHGSAPVERFFDDAPWVVCLKAYYAEPDVSWYAGRGPGEGDVRLAVITDDGVAP